MVSYELTPYMLLQRAKHQRNQRIWHLGVNSCQSAPCHIPSEAASMHGITRPTNTATTNDLKVPGLPMVCCWAVVLIAEPSDHQWSPVQRYQETYCTSQDPYLVDDYDDYDDDD